MASSTGDGNQLSGSQTGFAVAEITQRGDNNSLSFSQQTYYEGSRLSVSQDGVSNQAEIAQGDFEGSIERPVDFLIPYDQKLVVQAAKVGKPIAELGKTSRTIAPLIALYLAALLLKERIGRQAIGASLLGLVGVGVILSGRMRGDYDGDALMGAGAVLLSAMLFAWNLILQRQQAQLASPIEVAFFQHLVMLGVFAIGAPAWAIVPTGAAVPLVLLAAILAFTSLAALAWAYARAEAQRLIPVEYTAFVWAAIFGSLAFGEQLTLTTLAGALLIVAGCLIAARTKRADIAHVEAGAA